ncbi:MAG: winged helix-turn-helix transcriptional regulator [Candidatus Nitrosocaldus sp.]
MESTEERERLEVTVVVTIKDTSVEFRGTPEAVLDSLHRFLEREIPNLDLASRISLNYSLPQLMDMFAQYIRLTPEGPRVINDTGKRLSDKEVIALQLVAYKMMFDLKRFTTPSMTLQEIQAVTGLKPKSVSSRLSELVKAGYVEKEVGEQGTRYRVTTQGIHWLSNTLASKR